MDCLSFFHSWVPVVVFGKKQTDVARMFTYASCALEILNSSSSHRLLSIHLTAKTFLLVIR